MKKLTKVSLSPMAALLPELDEEDQRSILGGTATTATPHEYTGSVPVSTLTVTGLYDVTGFYPSSTTAPTGEVQEPTGAYTWEEMVRMSDDGSWYGGLVEGIGYVGEVTMVTGFVPTGAMDSSTTSSSYLSGWLEDAAQFVSEHVEAYIGVEGSMTMGQNFALQIRDGLGASLSPNYVYLLEGSLDSRDGAQGSVNEKRGTDFGVSYYGGAYFKSVTDGNQTEYSVGGGGAGCLGASYNWDNQGNHSIYVGIDVSGIVAACFGAEAGFKAGFFSNGKIYLY